MVNYEELYARMCFEARACVVTTDSLVARLAKIFRKELWPSCALSLLIRG